MLVEDLQIEMQIFNGISVKRLNPGVFRFALHSVGANYRMTKYIFKSFSKGFSLTLAALTLVPSAHLDLFWAARD